MKERILVVHNYYKIPGGEDVVVSNEINLLETHGHEVSFYHRNNCEIDSFSTLQKLLFPFQTIFSFKTFWEVRNLIKTNHIQMVHVHNTLPLISPSVYYAAWSMHVPVVQTLHNFRLGCLNGVLYRNHHICEECLSKGLHCSIKHGCYRNSRLQTFLCYISTRFHRLIHTYHKLPCIFLTKFNKETLLKSKDIKIKRAYIKCNFTNTSSFVNDNNNENYYIYAGRLEEIKGVKQLLKSFKILGDNARLLKIYGDGPLKNWCIQYINFHHLNIELHDFISHKELLQKIYNAKYLIIPSVWYEGMNMIIIEAYSLGIPVIGSDIGNINNLIKNDVTGLTFIAGDPKSLANVIKLSSSKTFNKNEIINYYNKNFSDEVNYQKLIKVYHDIKIHS